VKLSFDSKVRKKWHQQTTLVHGRIRRQTLWSDGPCLLVLLNTSGLRSIGHDLAWVAAQGGEILYEPPEVGGPGLLEPGSFPLCIMATSEPAFRARETIDVPVPDRIDLGSPPWGDGSVAESKVELNVFHVIGNSPALLSMASHALALSRPDHHEGDAIRYAIDGSPFAPGSVPFSIRKI
jgi:hypothetical protein